MTRNHLDAHRQPRKISPSAGPVTLAADVSAKIVNGLADGGEAALLALF